MIFQIAIIEDQPIARATIRDKCTTIASEMGIEFAPQEYKNSTVFHRESTKPIPDILIFDLNLDPADPLDRTGWDSIIEVMNNEFTPAILFSAHPEDAVPDELKDLYIIRVTKKGTDFGPLEEAIKKTIRMKKRYAQEKNRIIDEFKNISLCSFKTLFPYPGDVDIDENLLAIMAVSRVVSVLKNNPHPDYEKILPETIFLVPPLDVQGDENCIIQGDILSDVENDSIYLVVSPSCDLVKSGTRKRNIDKVLLLRCFKTKIEYDTANPHRDPISIQKLGNYESNGICYFTKAPKFLSKSGVLLICFKNYLTMDYDVIQSNLKTPSFNRIATIATPFAEKIHNLFISDLSRIGTPDILKPADDKQWKKIFIPDPILQTTPR